ncbi:hypothetical protein KRX54_01860 [Actinomycetaceae bacterium TAE3-ERU4]|nr:hypothetical protein [Actinomycetaceae bacterium TAE3-ERU4]
MAQKIKPRKILGWNPWPKRHLRTHPLSAITTRITNLHEYQQQVTQILPLIPIGTKITFSVVTSIFSALPAPLKVQDKLAQKADQMWAKSIEDLQEFFFDRPWLFEACVRAISRTAAMGIWSLKALLSLLDNTHLGSPQRRQTIRHALPQSGYRSFMGAYLSIATALGYFRGGPVHVRKINENGKSIPAYLTPPFTRPRRYHNLAPWETQNTHDKNYLRPQPLNFELRHLEAPLSLAECIADVDDLYWSSGAGMVIKIIKVGNGSDRRWVVIVPGTNHSTLETVANPADTESNVREMLGLRSAARAGVERALVAAFDEAKIPQEYRRQEKILIVGHSQGGVTAHALAADEKSDIQVTHVLTIGSPSRSIPIPEEVWSVSVEHIQDMIPWMDGVPEDQIDERVILRRKLEKPQSGPLYYAHSAGTYLETVKLIELATRQKIADAARGKQPLDKIGREVLELIAMLPLPDEENHVIYYEIAQEIQARTPLKPAGKGFIAKLVPDPDNVIKTLEERTKFDPYIPPNMTKNRKKPTPNNQHTPGGTPA